MPLYHQVKISISFLYPSNGKLFDSQKKKKKFMYVGFEIWIPNFLLDNKRLY